MTKTITKKPFRKLVAGDFDGVFHSYSTAWSGAGTISDGPTPGAMNFLRDIVDDGRFDLVIVSSRLSDPEGEPAMREWFLEHLTKDFGDEEAKSLLGQLAFSAKRPPAFVTIDDRAVTFLGEWPSLDRLAGFLPWNKKPKHLQADPMTSVAAIDALMMRIGRVAKEVGCPNDVAPLDWIEERARIGHAVATTSDAASKAEGRAEIDALIARTERAQGLRSLLETAWDLGAGTAYARRDRPADYEADGKSDETIRGFDVGRVLEKARKDNVAESRPTVDGMPAISADELPVPERMARYAAARGKSLDEVRADPAIVSPKQTTLIESDEAGEV